MEVFDYFIPVDFSKFDLNTRDLGKYSLGKSIETFTAKLSEANLSKIQIAIIGVPFDNGDYKTGAGHAPDLIRDQLYGLASMGRNINVADFGNLKSASSLKGAFLALRDIIEYFNESGIVSIIIGGSQDLTVGICEAFRGQQVFSLTAVDAVLNIKKGVESFNSTNYLTRIFKRLPNLFQFSLVGYQNHLVGEKLIKKTPRVAHHLRLGLLREHFLSAEPILRNSDAATFDMGAVKSTEAPAAKQQNPNGLRGEEICQLARFAGLSNRLKAFGLFELDAEKDTKGITAQLAAEIVWYFIEGFTVRHSDNVFVKNNKVTYKVEVKDLENPLVFLHEQETNRWWYEVTSYSGEIIVLACSEKDYNTAATNEIPEKWLEYLQKMDSLSK